MADTNQEESATSLQIDKTWKLMMQYGMLDGVPPAKIQSVYAELYEIAKSAVQDVKTIAMNELKIQQP